MQCLMNRYVVLFHGQKQMYNDYQDERMDKATAPTTKLPDPKKDATSTTEATRCLSTGASTKKHKDKSKTRIMKRKKTDSSLSLPCSSRVNINSGHVVIDISSDSE
jgi:hypothetical protein